MFHWQLTHCSFNFKVVKAFVVLTPEYVSHDPEEVIKELQDHVKKVTAPYKYPRKVSLQLPQYFKYFSVAGSELFDSRYQL